MPHSKSFLFNRLLISSTGSNWNYHEKKYCVFPSVYCGHMNRKELMVRRELNDFATNFFIHKSHLATFALALSTWKLDFGKNGDFQIGNLYFSRSTILQIMTGLKNQFCASNAYSPCWRLITLFWSYLASDAYMEKLRNRNVASKFKSTITENLPIDSKCMDVSNC